MRAETDADSLSVQERLDTLNAEYTLLVKDLNTMKSDLATAAQEATAAAAVTAELDQLANAEAEYDRLYLQFGYLDVDI